MKGTILLGTICAFAAGTLSLFGEKIAVEQFGPAAVKQPDNSYLISSGNYVFSSQLIPVKDLVKETVVTIDLKAPADLAKGVEYYVGILNFDKEGKRIQISYVNPVKGSDTILAAPCAKTRSPSTSIETPAARNFGKKAQRCDGTTGDTAIFPPVSGAQRR